MHTIFAVQPEAIDNWSSLRYVVEKFGYSKGLLIARYPKRWMAMVMDACRANGVGDRELKCIEEKLSQVKQDRLYKLSLPYIESSWLNNVLRPEVIGSLDAVLVRGEDDEEKVYNVDAAPEDLFENRRDIKVRRRATELARAASCLLSEVSYIVLVDPYFQPKDKCKKVLTEMIRCSRVRGKGVSSVVIYLAHSKSPEPDDVLKAQYLALLQDCVRQGVRFVICRVNDKEIDFDFHARYLLTDKGGLRYDRGFVEPVDHSERDHETDITCMDSRVVEELLHKYSADLSGISAVEVFNVP